MRVPTYLELPFFEKTGERHAWEVFGHDDQLGTINLLTPERVKHAASLVRKGKVICLSLPLNFPITLFTGHRQGYEHHVLVDRGGRDDYLDNFAPQGSSQWDGLRHIRYREYGYFGGRQDEDLDQKGELGIEHWAQHGIVGRGVLLDVARDMEQRGRPLDPTRRFSIDGLLLAEVAQAESVTLMPGDILLLRTGWMPWYMTLTQEAKEKLRGTLHPHEGGLECPGLDPGQAMAAWLWDRQIAAVAADNPTVEALRVERSVGFQHRRLIALLGMPIGEFWNLEELSTACAGDGIYEFMLVSVPLYIPGGVGSPANAYAIK